MRLGIQHPLGKLELGESVAINGVCLTVVESNTTRFVVDVSQETLQVTALSRASTGGELNLERALRLGDRLGGHLVSGHVDGLAQVRSLQQAGQASAVEFSAPTALLVFVATKGSVTLDGVSLTVNRVQDDGFEVMLIPHTRAVTTLGKLAIGSQVNLEVDLLARYVCRYLDMRGQSPSLRPGAASAGLEEALKRSGLM
jgi:riboflavin synthase